MNIKVKQKIVLDLCERTQKGCERTQKGYTLYGIPYNYNISIKNEAQIDKIWRGPEIQKDGRDYEYPVWYG